MGLGSSPFSPAHCFPCFPVAVPFPSFSSCLFPPRDSAVGLEDLGVGWEDLGVVLEN